MKRHALFVGVDKYADGHIPNLSCAVSDATDLHGFFKYGAGYDRGMYPCVGDQVIRRNRNEVLHCLFEEVCRV